MGFGIVAFIYVVASLLIFLVTGIISILFLCMKAVRHSRLKYLFIAIPFIAGAMPLAYLSFWMHSINNMSPEAAYHAVYGVEPGRDILDLKTETRGINDFQSIFLSFKALAQHAEIYSQSSQFTQTQEDGTDHFRAPIPHKEVPSWWTIESCNEVVIFEAKNHYLSPSERKLVLVEETGFDWNRISAIYCPEQEQFLVLARWVS